MIYFTESQIELSNLSVDPDTGTLDQNQKKLTTRNSMVKRSDMLYAAKKAMKIKIAKQKNKHLNIKKNNKAVFTYLNEDDSDSSSDSSSEDEISNDPLELEETEDDEPNQLQKLFSTGNFYNKDLFNYLGVKNFNK